MSEASTGDENGGPSVLPLYGVEGGRASTATWYREA